MKKIIIKTITIIIAFCAGIAVCSYLFNKGNLDMTAHMSEATLPILYFEHDGEYVNPTYGYTSEADASCMRSSVLTLDESEFFRLHWKNIMQRLSLWIMKCEASIWSV